MTDTISTSRFPKIGRWQDLYRLALFETDKQKLSVRIAEAEHALRMRAAALVSAGSGSDDEAQQVDDALYALQALRHCLKFGTTGDEAA